MIIQEVLFDGYDIVVGGEWLEQINDGSWRAWKSGFCHNDFYQLEDAVKWCIENSIEGV